MKSMLVIGAGRFGKNLAITLAKCGNEVMVVDEDEDEVSKIAPFVTKAQIGDCMDMEVLNELGVRNFDVCFVCISDNFQSSMEITSFLKELGARYVVSKSNREVQADLLKKIGADEVIYPERDMAKRTAIRFSAKGAFDYIELSPEYAIMEIEPPRIWIGHNLRELNVRIRHGVNIIGARMAEQVRPIVDADYIFKDNEHIVIAGSSKALFKLIDK